jgi:hypothetical protein
MYPIASCTAVQQLTLVLQRSSGSLCVLSEGPVRKLLRAHAGVQRSAEATRQAAAGAEGGMGSSCLLLRSSNMYAFLGLSHHEESG